MASVCGFLRFRSPAAAARPLVCRPRLAEARPTSAARRATRLSARSSTVTAAGPSSREPSPLQRALEAEGVADWAAYDTPYLYGTLGDAPGLGHLAAKITELSREGLAAADVERLFQQRHNSPVPCDLEAVFRPNLAYLRALLAGMPNAPKRREPAGLTVLGRLLRDQPKEMAVILSRDPARVEQLDQWVCGELKVSREELAGAILKYPQLLRLSAAGGRAVAGFLRGELRLPQQQVVHMLLSRPEIFNWEPSTLHAKVWQLGEILGVEESAIVQLVMRYPVILTISFVVLPDVLAELDRLFDRQGAGVELVLRNPVLVMLTVPRIIDTVQALRGLGLDNDRIRVEVNSFPSLLTYNLEGADQQQKLAWAAEHLPGVSIAGLIVGRLFSTNLRKMASRHAFMRHLGLEDCIALASMTTLGDPKFLQSLSRRAGWEVTAAEFEAFAAAWLEASEGQRWGFKPEKRRVPPAPRRKKGSPKPGGD